MFELTNEQLGDEIQRLAAHIDAAICEWLAMIAEFVSGRQGITPEEASAWEEDLRSLGPSYFFSLNRYLFVAEVS